VKKEIAPPVMIGIICAVVIVVIGIGWYVLKPAAPERVPPRQANATRTQLLQRASQGQAPNSNGTNQ
jgi:hypothetical protein